MGAMISWAVACAAPERISGVLAASAPFVIHPSRVDLFSTLARLRTETNEADWFRLLFQFLFSKSFFEGSGQPDSEMEDAVSAAVQISMNYEHKQGLERFKQQCSALPTFLETPELPQTFSFPCLALTGANDKLFTPEDLSSSYAAHPEIKLEVINDAAHAVHWENTTAFVDIASRFINQVTR